jgi:phosphodiesterase/alkaline phosphatase D-like protein
VISARWRVALALVIALAAFGAMAGTAGAAYRHPSQISQFGRPGTEVTEYEEAFGGLHSLSVDQARNRLYVGTQTAIYGYSIATAAEHAPLGGAFPIGTGEGYGTSVGADSVSGNIYAVNGYYGTHLLGFNSSGSPLSGFPVNFAFPQCGLAVNNEGLVAESDPENGKLIRLFNSSGLLVRTIDVSSVGRPCQIAYDETTNNLYVSTYESGVFRFAAEDGYSAPVKIAPVGALGLAFDASRGVLYVLYSEHAVAYGADGEELETFASPSEGRYESSYGIAVDESTGVVYIGGGSYPTQIGVYPGAVVPDVTTGEPVGNETVSGHVDPAGGGNITECQVEYGETTAYGETAPCSPATPYTTTQNVTATLTGLTVEQTYHYRVVAGNAKGKNYGADETITPHHVVALRTNPANELTRTCATLHASFNGNGEETHYFFEYGETETYGSTSATPPGTSAGTGTGAQAESYRLCGLAPGTTYHVRVVASNPKGTSVGNDRTFRTVDAVELITTEPGTVLNAEEAVMHGSFAGNGEDTHYYFEYGYNTLYGSTAPAPPGADAGSPTGKTNLSFTLQGLYPGTTYHYRLVGTNAVGTSYGEDIAFTTPRLPTVALGPPSNEHELPDGSRSVTFNGSINPLNGGSTTYHFEYGPTTTYGTSTPESGPVGTDPNVHPVSAVVDGLAAGTTYHYRLVAHNSAGTSYSADQIYQAIPSPPTVVSSGVAGIGANSATVNAVVRPGNGSTVVYVDYGTTTEYGQTVQTGEPPAAATDIPAPLPADESAHAVSRTITGLQPNTTYHFRIAAINFAGTTYGPDQTFNTAGVPIILSEGAGDVGQNAATFVATVSPNLLATSYRFEYGPEGRYGSTTATASLGADGVGHQVSVHVGGLVPGTKYQVRVVATNEIGTTAGGGARFTTTAAPAAHKPLVCKKGTVKRKGKCVKKKPKKHKPKKHKKNAGHNQKGKR